MKRKNIITIVTLLVIGFSVYCLYEGYMAILGKREEEALEYFNKYTWHAKTEQIDIKIYANKGKVQYKYGEMEGIWALSTLHGASMKCIRISFDEIHDVQEDSKNEMTEELRNGFGVEIVYGEGKFEDNKLIIKFDDTDIFPEGVEELIFKREERSEEYIGISIDNTNEKLGNIGYKYITMGSEWKTKDSEDGKYMKLKEEDGKIMITYNIDGKEKKVEFLFSEGVGPNELASFDLKMKTNQKLGGMEESLKQYIYDNDGNICEVIEKEYGRALIYKDRMLLKFYGDDLIPNDFKEIVLYKQ